MSVNERIYLDHAATTPVRPEVAARMAEVMTAVGNPSSVHKEGRAARRVLEDAREAVAAAVGGEPDNVTFTSGGTEANDLAMNLARSGKVLVAATEHASVLDAIPDAVHIPVLSSGLLDLDALDRLLESLRPALISVMAVNNETGVVQDIPEVSARCRRVGALMHVDAIQGLGKAVNLRLADLGCDLLTVSAHKIGGPAGVGALTTTRSVQVEARLRGGGQEGRRRAGTHNLPGIAGFAEAVRRLDAAEPIRQERLRLRLEDQIVRLSPATRVAAQGVHRAPHVTSLVTPGQAAELQVIGLDLAGAAVSAGSACSSGKVAASHVLAAMGFGGDAACAIRVSLGWSTTEQDIDRFATMFAQTVGASSNRSSRGGSLLPNVRTIAT